MYSALCQRTVTVYRLWDGKVFRQVLDGCYLRTEDALSATDNGCQLQPECHLVVPGEKLSLRPGDLVYQGEGPVITREQWQDFVPGAVEGLYRLEYVQPVYLGGKLMHTEAGTRNRAWR